MIQSTSNPAHAAPDPAQPEVSERTTEARPSPAETAAAGNGAGGKGKVLLGEAEEEDERFESGRFGHGIERCLLGCSCDWGVISFASQALIWWEMRIAHTGMGSDVG